jgi:succinate dehydrogenase/fumarate reductase flavoprotein subunit
MDAMRTNSRLDKSEIEGADETFDVIVVGFGLAGGMAAIEAADQGAKVLLIEKMPDPGGISICAGGGVRIAFEAAGALSYLTHTTAGVVPQDVLKTMVDGMMSLEGEIRKLAKVNNAEVSVRRRGGNYPFPGHDALGILEVTAIPDFEPLKDYPHVRGRLLGPTLFKLVHDNVKARPIEVRLDTAAKRLLTTPDGEIRGLAVEQNGKPRMIGSRRGVVLACGGFEASAEMQARYWQIRPVFSAATKGNTGDGIRMAQALGADLWHMWHFHGSYGFRHTDPAYPYAIRIKRLPDWTPTVDTPNVPMSWIVLDRRGRRFMNEYHPYSQDTSNRELDVFDPVTQSFPYIPAFLVVDDDGRKLYPLGQAVLNDRHVKPYIWSTDNLAEVENGLLKKANSIEELAAIIGAPPEAVQATLDRWNTACETGNDVDFGRTPSTMVPVRRPPFFVGEIWPLVNNTQGGPVHDKDQRVLNTFGEPIPRLFEAGELGSIWAYLYLGAGNIAECFITGKIAGARAAALAPLDVGARVSAGRATRP